MENILLASKEIAIVDGEDFDWINRWIWRLHSNGYAVRSLCSGRRTFDLLLHRAIIDWHNWYIAPGRVIDHVNGDKLDNRKKNLRIATMSQNAANTKGKGLNAKNTSGYPGVFWHTQGGKWTASIQFQGKRTYLGIYATKEEAHEAYCKAKKSLHGEFSGLD